MPEPVSVLAFTNVHRRFGDRQAVAGVSLSLAAGTTTALIGPSGCGKSTLLRLAVGLEWPDAGQVCLRGEELTDANLLAHRRRTGYVIQDGGLFPHLRAGDNIALLGRHLGWEPGRIRRRQAELCDLVRLPVALMQQFPLELSGGERQRVSLARALLPDPDLLLLDEPLAALDPLIRVELQELLLGVFTALGKTVLLVTHDLAEATFFSSRIVLMRAGAVVQEGTMGDLLHRPADPFVTRFVHAQRDPLRVLAEPGP